MNVSKIRIIVEHSDGEVEELMDIVPDYFADNMVRKLEDWREQRNIFSVEEVVDYIASAEQYMNK